MFGKEGHLVGMGAANNIEKCNMFLFVPCKLIISEFTVRNSPVVKVIDAHPEIFKNHFDAEYLILIAFLWYEKMKGEKSFYHPYFEVINMSDLPIYWTEEEKNELQDATLIKEVNEYAHETEQEWVLLYNTFRFNKYEEFFPGITDEANMAKMKEYYDFAFNSTVTRCFGWGLPKTMMVPFADCINHHNMDSTYELINTKLHRQRDLDQGERGPEAYYSKSKLEMNYSDLAEDLRPPSPHESEPLSSKTINKFKKNYMRTTLFEDLSVS